MASIKSIPMKTSTTSFHDVIHSLSSYLSNNEKDRDEEKDIFIWNEDLERVVRNNPMSLFANEFQDSDTEKLFQEINQTSLHLRRSLISSLNEINYANSENIIFDYDNENLDVSILKLSQWLSNRSPSIIEREMKQFEMIIVILRTIKNVMRLTHHYMMIYSKTSFISQQSSRTNPLQALKNKQMACLYFALFHLFATVTDPMKAKKEYVANLARYSSHALFHTTFGSNDILSKEVQTFFFSPNSDSDTQLNTVSILMKILLFPNNAAVMASLMKIIHHSLGNKQTLYSTMNLAIQKIVRERWNPKLFQGNDEIEDDDYSFPVNILKNISSSVSEGALTPATFPVETLEAILISTVANTVQYKGTESNQITTICDAADTDLRPELALEILNILFIIQSIHNKNNTNTHDCGHENEEKYSEMNDANMYQLGILLTEILLLSNQNVRVYKLKLAVVNLLLDAPDSYGQYLCNNKALPHLWTILEIQLNKVVGTSSNSNGKRSDAPVLLPILLLWTKFIKVHPTIFDFCRDYVFPLDIIDNETDVTTGPIAKTTKANMAPINAPQGTIRYKLIKLMTWLESNLKRASSELLWILCNEDPALFVKRTGFGNAAHLLGMKGLLNIPKS